MDKKSVFVLTLAALVAVAGTPALADSHEKAGEEHPKGEEHPTGHEHPTGEEHPTGHDHGEMSDEEKAAMEMWQKAMTPGEPHAWLATREGTWTASITMWMDPSAEEPDTMTGTAKRKMLLGGRVLKEHFTGEFQGMPFEGIGMTGYDNVTGKYWSTWTDNMGTGLFKSTGEMGEDGKLVMKGKGSDPMSGQVKESKWVSWDDEDGTEHNEAYEMRDGEMVKTMAIAYQKQ